MVRDLSVGWKSNLLLFIFTIFSDHIKEFRYALYPGGHLVTISKNAGMHCIPGDT